jgi:hypothetical protein
MRSVDSLWRHSFRSSSESGMSEAGGLRHAFDQEHAGHDRIAGEVSLKIGFIRRHVFDSGSRPVTVHIDDAIDQEERIAMGQELEDRGDIQAPTLAFGAALIHP